MPVCPSPRVVRLNARTLTMDETERSLLATLDAELIEVEGATDTEVLDACRAADAILIVSAYLRGTVIAELTRCKIISRIGTGVDKIDIDAATRQGIIVNNLPNVFTDEVADHTLALLLAAARQIKFLDREMRQGRRPLHLPDMHRLGAQTVGIIGFGLIGRAVARRCRAFGLRVLAHDPCLTPELAVREGVTVADLDTVLAESDYLCPLCPLLPQTRGMLALPQFRKMKRTAVLVNTGRGELANEDDLAAAGSGRVSVSVDKVTLTPGAVASGTVTFSDGVVGKWIVDNYGRPGFTQISKPDYRPKPADAQAFMQELAAALEQRGV